MKTIITCPLVNSKSVSVARYVRLIDWHKLGNHDKPVSYYTLSVSPDEHRLWQAGAMWQIKHLRNVVTTAKSLSLLVT
jgi:hypothetical protein